MKATLGYGASTCSYADWLHADLIVLFGSNVANNQPVATKYLHAAKKNGARIAVVNPYREPGLNRYWVPSIPESAVFGTQLADEWFDVHTGGDVAFLVGVFRSLVEHGELDEAFVREHTIGFEAARSHALGTEWDQIVEQSGASRERIENFARLLAAQPNAIFIWSMGLTQRANGVDAVKALINVALARGLVGRPNRGLVPIRGHSGVQGGAEVGCVPALDCATSERFARVWSFPVPALTGVTTTEMIAASAVGDVDLFWMVGGNFLETLGDASRSAAALRRPRLRVHQDIVLSSAMLVDGEGDVVVLPSTTRYESPGGGTETSTERRIIFSPEIPGRRIGTARPEWMVFRDVMTRAYPERRALVGLENAAAIRREIARAVPLYAGIERLERKGDQIQWGGPHLFADGRFATPDGKAHFSTVSSGHAHPGGTTFVVSTRRGKQFNSMVQRDVDPLTGAGRDAILISRDDLARLHLEDGSLATLRSPRGTFTGRLQAAPMRPGNLEVHWPEGNVLLAGDLVDPDSMEPDYNAEVTIDRA
jgi:molybdopterin-dependent oxidoreductase alpha subunit